LKELFCLKHSLLFESYFTVFETGNKEIWFPDVEFKYIISKEISG